MSKSRALSALVVIIAALFHTLQAVASDVDASTANRTAVIGTGYQSEKQLMSGKCLDASTTWTGQPTSTFNFSQSLTEQQASNELGVSLGGRARFGVVETSATANFMRSAVSNKYSVSAVWLSDYRLPTQKLLAQPNSQLLSPVGRAVDGNDERWAETCGDEYVEEITKGAKLFFS
ncbi:MAG TPA: hypothetical protein VF713_09410, partial [Thermoanaerobaculia bacterium]